MSKIGIIGIDYQIDFMDSPGSALPVTGANDDAERFAAFVTKYRDRIQSVYLTQDSHHTLDIAHPSWWKKADGSQVDPFTIITTADLNAGTYYPTLRVRYSREYVKALEDQGEYIHMVWPEHCIVGTTGHTFHPAVQKMIADFERNCFRWVNVITKGSNPNTEHYGAFRANIEQADDPSTQLSQVLLNSLNELDQLFLAGEAQSHCVANSLKQLLDNAPDLIPKMVILEDTMSPVLGLPSGFYDGVKAIYDRAKTMGAKFAKTTDFTTI
jgi:nicotinamidase-related amidase